MHDPDADAGAGDRHGHGHGHGHGCRSAADPDPDDRPFAGCTPSRMSREAFVATFGDIYESSRWIAERAWDAGIDRRHDRLAALAAHLRQVFDDAPPARRLQVLRAHPDLAGRVAAAPAGALSEASGGEQAGAGLTACTPAEYHRFQTLNAAYREKFGFPFILAVKGLQRREILACFEQRLGNGPAEELATALAQVNRIALLRLRAL